MRPNHGGSSMMLASLLDMLEGRPTDRIVWAADITYWMEGCRQSGRADPDWATEEGRLRLHQRLGIMPYFEYSKFNAYAASYSKAVAREVETRGRQTATRYATPMGELTDIWEWCPESCSSACVRHAVQSAADLDRLLWLLENRRLTPANLDDYAERRELWARYDGLPPVGLPRSPLPSLLVEWAGVEATAYLLCDHEERVRQILGVMEEQEAPVVEAIARLRPPLVHFPDNLSSATAGGYYGEFIGPAHRRRLARLHAAGVKCAVHLDGTVHPLLAKLAAAGFDAVEALTPKPAGDLGPRQMREAVAGAHAILWGGVPGVMFAPPYAWRDMEAHVAGLLESWRGHSFIVGVADQVPPDGDIGFCRRIADMLAGAAA